jgi:hypothetical protein
MAHQLFSTDILDNSGVNTPFSLKKPENKALSGSASSALALATTAEVSLVQLNLAAQSSGFQLRRVIERLSQVLVDASHYLHIHAQVSREPVGRDKLVESFDNINLASKLRQALLTLTALALNVAASCLMNLEGATEDALFTAHKVGRATEMARSGCNHRTLAYVTGYFSP